jgi:DNA repair exonuclease SbcCD ATPase subunit
MSAPRLKSLSGSNFGPFKGEFSLELPATGLLLLTGVNLHTQGSSGSGKSSLIHALTYPLGTCDVPLTELQNWDTEETPTISGLYEVAGKEVTITRGRKFLLYENGELQKGSADQKEEKIDQYFGMDAEMRAALTYRGQGQPGLFLSKANSDKNEFLTKILRLFRFEEAEKKSDTIVKDLEFQVSVLQARKSDLLMRKEQLGPELDRRASEARVTAVKRAIATEAEYIAVLEKEMATMRHDADVLFEAVPEMFQGKVDAVATRLQALQQTVVEEPTPSPEATKAVAMHEECGRRYDRLLKEDQERRFHWDQDVRDLNVVINRLVGQIGKVHAWLAAKDRIEADLKVLATNVCPTCSREWNENEAKKQELRDELAVAEGKIAECNLVQQKIVELSRELKNKPPFESNPKVEQMANAVSRAAEMAIAEREKWFAAKKVARAGLDQQIAEAKTELANLHNNIRAAADVTRKQALAGIGGMQQLVFMSQDTVTKLGMELEDATYQMGRVEERDKQATAIAHDYAETMSKLDPLQKTLSRERDFQHLVSREGFRGSIFDEVLAEISDETNQILAGIANTANCTLHFTSESTTAKGTVKREIVPVVTINGHKATLKFGPSGGMRSAIDLAVDLAVGAVISRREGVTPGWLILDESFDGLGPVEKSTCMEILQRYAQERLVIVVDHSSETQGLFTQRIKVEYLDGVSRIC